MKAGLDKMLGQQKPKQVEAPPPVARQPYSPQAMVQLLVEHPEYTRSQVAGEFGQRESWLPLVLASQAFQDEIAPVRHLIYDPYWTATLEERFRGLAIQGASVIATKLGKDDVADFTALKAAELGIKALGIGTGQQQQEKEVRPSGPAAIAAKLKNAMLEARSRVTVVDAEFTEVPADAASPVRED